jgi:hypothetical protein
MSAQRAIAEFDQSGNLIQGGPMEGSGAMSFTASDGSLSMIISMSSSGTFLTFSADNKELKLTIGLAGNGTLTMTGDSSVLSMIVPFDGSGSMSLTGTADLRGLLSLIGEWTPYTELSPENLARAVWADDTGAAIIKLLGSDVVRSGDTITIKNDDGSTWREYDLADGGRVLK